MKEPLETTIAKLIEFLYQSPTPEYAVKHISTQLNEQGLTQLDLNQDWKLKVGAGYYVIKPGAIIAFYAPKAKNNAKNSAKNSSTTNWRIVGAHTDSPCLKLRNQPLTTKHGYSQLEIEVYGGVKLESWFDRDLSIAGQVFWQDATQKLHASLTDFAVPCVNLLSLAAHLKGASRNAGPYQKFDVQKEVVPLFFDSVFDSTLDATGKKPKSKASKSEASSTWDQVLMAQIEKELEVKPTKILNHNLCLYDSQPPQKMGSVLSSARLDNLVSCHSATHAFLAAKAPGTALALYNFEEIGSQAYQGAQSPWLGQVLQHITGAASSDLKTMANSCFLSVDCAHALHPNYPERFAVSHSPVLDAGVVIKQAVNQTYASDPELQAKLCQIWQNAQVPLQISSSNANFRSGKTIAPIAGSSLGIPTLDIGIATFAMHSIRELIGQQDVQWLNQAIYQFLTHDL